MIVCERPVSGKCATTTFLLQAGEQVAGELGGVAVSLRFLVCFRSQYLATRWRSYSARERSLPSWR